MLALERPFGVVADLALFGDHADPKRVYYVPTRPRLAREDGLSELSFVKFRDADAADGGVGLLSFTTEVIATDEQLDEAKQHLVRNGVPEPLLVQVPWTAGKAVFAAALQEGDGFVEKLLGEVTPDLAATNRAMFSALLTDEGARLVEALLQGSGPSPLGVRYELEYAGLRPALDVKVRADYKRIYQELSWGFQFGVAYSGVGVRASVESATQKLVEAGAIQIEVMHFTDSTDLRARVDEAIRWLQEKILEDFFKSSLQPSAQENLLQKAIEAATRMGASTLQDALRDNSIASRLAQELGISPDALSRLSQGGGQGAGGANQSTFALKLQFSFRDIKQEELKSIELDWREARAEKRTAAPQGLLSQFGVTPTIVEASDAGTFWDTLHVNVRPLGDFAALGVRRQVVQLAYPDEDAPATQVALTFEPGQSEPKKFSAWTDGKPPRYRARVEVHFDEDGTWPGSPLFIGGWQTQQSLELAVHPLSEVPKLEIEVAPGTLSFTDIPQAQVDLRLNNDIIATHMLTAAAPRATFRRRIEPALEQRLDARTTWFLAGGGRVAGDWAPVESTTLLIHAPWKSTRTLRVLPLLPAGFVEAVVTVTMIDGGRTETADVRFEEGNRQAKVVTLPSLSEQPPPVQIDTVVIRGDFTTFTGHTAATSDPVVLVRDREGPVKQIAVRLLAGPSLAGHGLMAVQAQLLGSEDEVLDSVVFTESQRAVAQLLVDVGVGSPKGRYRVVRYGLDGAAAVGPVQDITSSELLVPAVTRP